jgi:5-formyltetrahydrofolate cyclo-ligase
MAQSEGLKKALVGIEAFVTYSPLRTEVNFRDFYTIPPGAPTYEIAPRASLDPFAEAKKAVQTLNHKKVAILMPGRKLDATGTRVGQGGGWYDKFLSVVPPEWTRIAFCHMNQFSLEPIKREVWDQIMDYVCVVDEAGGIAVYETKARVV